MAKQVPFFAGPDDELAFRAYFQSEQLYIVPIRADLKPDVIQGPRHPICFVSPVPQEQLHPDTQTPPCVDYTRDPLIELARSYYVPPHLVAGRIWWPGERGFGRQSKPVYEKLARWIRSNWLRREIDGFYIGPDAIRLERDERAQLVYLPPQVKIEVVKFRSPGSSTP